MKKCKLSVLPQVIKLIENQSRIVFVDEAMFTSGQIRARYWAKAGDESLNVEKLKIGFKEVAVVGAIDLSGRVVALLTREKSIATDDFVAFLKKLKQSMRKQKTYIFLDNLRVHHTHIIAKEAKQNN